MLLVTTGTATIDKLLIFVPTYNERENAGEMFRQLTALGLDADILFVDDSSPDGTGELLDELAKTNPRLSVLHRPKKSGIGTAHQAGIAWAYANGYTKLVTMDCDFTHSPQDIPRLLAVSADYDVVVGSRFLQPGSLPGWNLLRRFLTNFGHFVTRKLLRIPVDATGAFRVYNLQRIPQHVFKNIRSRGYSFFFEGLLLLISNGYSVQEVAIVLPARTYGHSKMSLKEAWRSLLRAVRLGIARRFRSDRLKVPEPFVEINPALHDPQNWDAYWEQKRRTTTLLYEMVARIYRNGFIRPQLNRFIRKHFPKGSSLLHAGCGSGQVDGELQHEMRLTAVDISVSALELYQSGNPQAHEVRHATIFDLPFPAESFDGAYNLGVVEHFYEPEIKQILSELRRVVKPDGKVILFWPFFRGSSVLFLKASHWVLNSVLRRNVQLHPPEVSLFRSRDAVSPLLAESGFQLVDYYFGGRDLFVQAVLVLQRSPLPAVTETAATVSAASS